MPCSSGIQPGWVVHAVERGFDGVFIATDGDECALLPDCNERSARIAALAQEQLRAKGYPPQRVRMSALCSVCAEPFVKHMREFSQMLAQLGPVVAQAA